ncbi:DNA-binding domain-containing protein [Roseovarius sp. LXJ103]|uniref:HvfC/BufC N-terminal domain-containing protein n=1 Tax=Roseovarius carneus TaxID=2853164 RepID=UPI000D61A2A4|nr:DNA-binding domain-containing protein [Roseovarius carneus]MBZ8117100.1 DNA-binding domain-containing protein [Roseovarius carneus]PWE37054.1 DUF2063 domain-containing protein [Pelagicola sp. LXJ1103]
MSVTQSAFRAALLDNTKAVPEGLTDGQGRPAGPRFSVYRNNVAVSLTEALEVSFPAIRKLIGDENFRGLMGIFLRQHPPTAPMISQYGDALPGFIEGFSQLNHLGYLPDVARLEQALRESYHSADADPIDPALLQSLAPDALMGAHLTLAPALHLIRSEWPVHQIWAYNMEDGAPKPTGGAQDVLVTRPQFDPVAAPLPSGGAAFIAALAEGQTFGTAFEAASEAPDFDLTPTLSALITGRAIIQITPGDI